AGRGGVALGDDLAERAAAGPNEHRLERVAPAPDRGEEHDVAARVHRRRIETGDHARGHARRGTARDRDGVETAPRPREDPLDRAAARHGGGEHDGAVVADGRCRMLGEPGEAADPRHAIALAGHREDASATAEEDALVGAAAAELREERDLTLVVDG